jgi:succinate dehydrogenase/fumarate reductase cytochrome b subunit
MPPAHSGCGCGGHAAHGKKSHSCATRNWRRVHAALGVGIIAFLLLHFAVAALAFSPTSFEAVAARLREWTTQAPLLLFVLLGILAAQVVTGGKLMSPGRHGTRHGENPLRMSVQRWSGMLVLVFLLVHVVMALGRGVGVTPSAARAALFAGNPLLVGFYAISVAGLAWHAGHGVWTGASSWSVREQNPALWRAVAIVTGLVLAALGGVALLALTA